MAKKERSTLEAYVLGTIGTLPLRDVRPSHSTWSAFQRDGNWLGVGWALR